VLLIILIMLIVIK